MNIIDANRKHIEAALEYSGGTHDFDDVRDGILSGKMQLWPGERSAVVTEIVEYAKKRTLHVFLAGGDLDELLGGMGDAIAWGRAQGCNAMTLSGRRGWEKVLGKHGFHATRIVMERDI